MTNRKLFLLFSSFIILVLSVWTLNLWYCADWETSERGTFGDLFGASNALFSGLAFAGVLITLLLQRQQIIDAQRATRDQTGLFLRQLFESTFLRLIEFHQTVISGLRLQRSGVTYEGVEVLEQIFGCAKSLYNSATGDSDSRLKKAFSDLPKEEYSELFKVLKSFVYILNYINESDVDAKKQYEMLLSLVGSTEIVLLVYVMYTSEHPPDILRDADPTRFLLPQFLFDQSHYGLIKQWIGTATD